jgi:hypothetical protein
MAASLTPGRARVLENDSRRHLGPSRAEIAMTPCFTGAGAALRYGADLVDLG